MIDHAARNAEAAAIATTPQAASFAEQAQLEVAHLIRTYGRGCLVYRDENRRAFVRNQRRFIEAFGNTVVAKIAGQNVFEAAEKRAIAEDSARYRNNIARYHRNAQVQA